MNTINKLKIFLFLLILPISAFSQQGFDEIKKVLSNYNSNQLIEMTLQINFYEDLKKPPGYSHTVFTEYNNAAGYYKIGNMEILYYDNRQLHIDHDDRLIHYSDTDIMKPESMMFFTILDSLNNYVNIKTVRRSVSSNIQEVTFKIPDSEIASITIQYFNDKHLFKKILIETIIGYDIFSDKGTSVWYEFAYEDFKMTDKPFPKSKYEFKNYLVFQGKKITPVKKFAGYTVVSE